MPTNKQSTLLAGAKIPTHSHSLVSQLSHPREVLDMVQLKLQGKTTLKDPVGTKLSTVLWQHLTKTSRSFAAVIRVLPPSTADAVVRFASNNAR